MSIDLQVDSVIGVEDEVTNQHVWPLVVTATSNQAGLSSKIFVYHAEDGDDPYLGDVFECVASVQQMTEIPEDEGGGGEETNQTPYYRTEVLNFHCRSALEASELLEKVEADVKDLLQNYVALTGGNLQTSQTINVTI